MGRRGWTALVAAAICATVALRAGADGGNGGNGETADSGYELKLEPASVQAITGASGTLSLTIAPKPGFSIGRDGPLRVKVTVSPAEGLVLPRRQYRRKDAADARADAPRFDLKYRAERSGDYRVSVDARFWVCRRYTCRAVSETRQVGVRVQDPEPPPGADAGPPTTAPSRPPA